MENSADIPTIEEVAKVLRCSKAHVQNALRGKLRGVPRLMHLSMGRRKVVRREWLQQWVENGKTQ
ncbi:MAG: helix-turn-helix domain-containing protein [Acidobacteriaceae bacterium]|nr:helix-turn-helix domain-containing protein [Acidobacteriaceae bacterium]